MFKSGVILERKCAVVLWNDDSYTQIALLESLGINYTSEDAQRISVMAKLVPDYDEWWVSPKEQPGAWKFVTQQDIFPDWFDREKYEQMFRECVCDWWDAHVLVDKQIVELSSGYYLLKRCDVERLCKDVVVMMDNSHVGEMALSTVGEMWGYTSIDRMSSHSNVDTMHGYSVVREMSGSSNVIKMMDHSRVNEMSDHSGVTEMDNQSNVGKMMDSSYIGKMWGQSYIIEMSGQSNVEDMFDYSNVCGMWEQSSVSDMSGYSVARDFTSATGVKILVPATSIDEFGVVAFPGDGN